MEIEEQVPEAMKMDYFLKLPDIFEPPGIG